MVNAQRLSSEKALHVSWDPVCPLNVRQVLLPCTQRLQIPQDTVWRSARPGFPPAGVGGVSACVLAARLTPELLGGFCTA